MSVRFQVAAAVLLLAAFAAGRYSVPIKPDVRQTAVTVADTKVRAKKDVHEKTVIVKEPSGRETTTITEDITSVSDAHKDETSRIDTTVTQPKRSAFSMSALAAIPSFRNIQPAYGVGVSREVLGPITAGVFGLTNGTIGVSIGLNF